jgi:hypothetical protein
VSSIDCCNSPRNCIEGYDYELGGGLRVIMLCQGLSLIILSAVLRACSCMCLFLCWSETLRNILLEEGNPGICLQECFKYLRVLNRDYKCHINIASHSYLFNDLSKLDTKIVSSPRRSRTATDHGRDKQKRSRLRLS